MGSQSALAKAVGVSDNAISKWVAKGYVPASRAIQVETLISTRIAENESLTQHRVSLHRMLLESAKHNDTSRIEHEQKIKPSN